MYGQAWVCYSMYPMPLAQVKDEDTLKKQILLSEIAFF